MHDHLATVIYSTMDQSATSFNLCTPDKQIVHCATFAPPITEMRRQHKSDVTVARRNQREREDGDTASYQLRPVELFRDVHPCEHMGEP